MAKARPDRCETCTFRERNEYHGEGAYLCHRFPPVRAEFARVQFDDWCGEWRPDNDAAAPATAADVAPEPAQEAAAPAPKKARSKAKGQEKAA